MLILDLTNEPRWLELLPGLRLKLRPLGTALMVAARADPEVEALPADTGTDALGLAMAKAVARRAVLDWEGVGDADGNALPVTPEGVDALLEVFPLFEAFQTAYVAKGLTLELEKNVSPPSPNGASVGAEATATPVRARARSARRGSTAP